MKEAKKWQIGSENSFDRPQTTPIHHVFPFGSKEHSLVEHALPRLFWQSSGMPSSFLYPKKPSSFLFLFLFQAIVVDALDKRSLNWDPEKTLNNPLRGFVPYCCGGGNYDTFPHSMENFYITMKDLMNNWDTFDWSPLESQLNSISSRKHQAIFRVHVDFPGESSGADAIPSFLLPGLTLLPYTEFGGGYDPDYQNATFIQAMVDLIEALGNRYDGDNRIAFVQVGFLGHWGEWHTFPNEERFPPASIQDQILTAYNQSFVKTRILARYPNKIGSFSPEDLNIGFHDDSFAYSTLGSETWYFYPQLQSVNGEDRWKQVPIGGELRPELMPCIFSENTCSDPFQNFTECVLTTKCSWLWNHAAFSPGYSEEDKKRAQVALEPMGYQFFLSEIQILNPESSEMTLDIFVQNRGVAPFYYPLYLQLISGSTLVNVTTELHRLLPSDTPTKYSIVISNSEQWKIRMWSWILLEGQTISFANAEVEKDGSLALASSPAIQVIHFVNWIFIAMVSAFVF